jgi:hypothetical protein
MQYAGAYHDFDNTVSYLQRGAMVQTSRRCADREVDPVNWKYKLLASGETFSDYPRSPPNWAAARCATA